MVSGCRLTHTFLSMGYFMNEVTMKKTLIALSLLILLSVSACQQLVTAPIAVKPAEPTTEPTIVATATATETTAASVFQSAQVTVEYAKNFTIEYGDGYKLLTVVQPWTGAEQAYRYVLIPKGGQEPPADLNAMVVETPIDSFVAMSTTYYPFLDWIGKLDTIVAVDDPTYVFNADVQAKAAAYEIATVGSGSSVDIEQLIGLDPDVIMTSAYGSIYDSHPKLLEANLPVVLNADYLEESPLGRAEWGKFVAAFFDQEAEAEVIFNQVVSEYTRVKTLAESVTDKATVITNTDYQGTWYVPGAQSYAANLMKDAGAAYVFADETGSSLPLSFEVVFDQGKNADFWINVGFPVDKSSLLSLDSRYAEFAAYQNDRVYNNNARANANGGLDYFESGVASPDLVLKDLIKIFYPELLPEHALYYYQKLN